MNCFLSWKKIRSKKCQRLELSHEIYVLVFYIRAKLSNISNSITFSIYSVSNIVLLHILKERRWGRIGKTYYHGPGGGIILQANGHWTMMLFYWRVLYGPGPESVWVYLGVGFSKSQGALNEHISTCVWATGWPNTPITFSGNTTYFDLQIH